LIGNLWTPRPPRVLFDLREGGGIRGLHLAASLSLLIERPVEAEFWAVHADADTVTHELALLRTASGQPIFRWSPDVTHVRFAQYVVMADIWPRGATWSAAQRCSGHVMLGLMFPDAGSPSTSRLAVHDAHDTRAFADALRTRLRRGYGLRRWAGR